MVQDLGDVDLTDLDTFADGFPHDIFRLHRDQAPVWWHEPTAHTPDGEGFWSVATYDEVLQVLRDPVTYSSETGGASTGPTAEYRSCAKDLSTATGVAIPQQRPQHPTESHRHVPPRDAELTPVRPSPAWRIELRRQDLMAPIASIDGCDSPRRGGGASTMQAI